MGESFGKAAAGAAAPGAANVFTARVPRAPAGADLGELALALAAVAHYAHRKPPRPLLGEIRRDLSAFGLYSRRSQLPLDEQALIWELRPQSINCK